MEANSADLRESGKLPQVNYSAEYTFNKSSAICLFAPEEASSCLRWRGCGGSGGCGLAGGVFRRPVEDQVRWSDPMANPAAPKQTTSTNDTLVPLYLQDLPKQRLQCYNIAKLQQPEAEGCRLSAATEPWWNRICWLSFWLCFCTMNRWKKVAAFILFFLMSSMYNFHWQSVLYQGHYRWVFFRWQLTRSKTLIVPSRFLYR